MRLPSLRRWFIQAQNRQRFEGIRLFPDGLDGESGRSGERFHGRSVGECADEQQYVATRCENSTDCLDERVDHSTTRLTTREGRFHPIIPFVIRISREIWRIEHHDVEDLRVKTLDQIRPDDRKAAFSSLTTGVRIEVARNHGRPGFGFDLLGHPSRSSTDLEYTIVGTDVVDPDGGQKGRILRRLIDRGFEIPPCGKFFRAWHEFTHRIETVEDIPDVFWLPTDGHRFDSWL